jgi:hypothetical protein
VSLMQGICYSECHYIACRFAEGHVARVSLDGIGTGVTK